MPAQKRNKTQYPGIFYIDGTDHQGKPERIFYISYRKNGKKIEEKAGRQYKDNMTAAKANVIRSAKLTGKKLSNKGERARIRELNKPKMTFEKLWELYKESKGAYKTLKTDQGWYNKHLKDRFGKREPKDLSAWDLDRLRRDLKKKNGLKDQTVKHVLSFLRRLANFGMKKQLCQGLPFAIDMPKVNNEVDESLTPSQIYNLMEVLNAEDELNIIGWLMKVMLYTGRRTGEMCKLKWDDLDLENCLMTLRETKTGRTEVLPFSTAVKAIFETMPRFNSEFVFPNDNGTQRQACGRPAKKLQNKADLPESFRPTYCLRHTFASLAASAGISYQVLKVLVGHSAAKTDITARYAHISRDALRNAVEEIAIIINQILAEEAEKAAISC